MSSGDIYCRLCAELKPSNKQIDLQTDPEKHDEIVDKLARINAATEFIHTRLPKTVCLECLATLNKCFDFVMNVESSQNVLNKELCFKQEVDNDDDVSLDCNNDDIEVDIKTECPLNLNDVKPKKLTTKSPKTFERHSLDSIPLSQLKENWENYSWLCTYCETMFPTIDELHAHSITLHASCNPYRCTNCKIRKERLDKFIIHIIRHNKHLKFSCYKCFKTFDNLLVAKDHSKVHMDSKFICPGCNAGFNNRNELNAHRDMYYKVRYQRDLPEDKNLTCTDCLKTFKSRSGLNAHLIMHTERKREHICEICGKCFFQKHNLACHMLMHSDERPFKCQICKLRFKTGTRLKHHIGVHNNDKPFSCDQCGRRFRLLKQLKNHSIIHTDSLPYQCSQCEKRFRFKSILNNHIRLHTGDKPYTCATCPRDFANWSNYNKHMKRKHNHDTSKKKHTPEGLYPIDPNTGEVLILPQTKQIEDWKKQILKSKRPGRPMKAAQHVVKTESNTDDPS